MGHRHLSEGMLRRYCLAMTSPGTGMGFSLVYEMRPDDLEEAFTADAARRRRRSRMALSLAAWVLIAAFFTAVTVALDHPSVVKASSGAPSWMYPVDVVSWLLALSCAEVTWRLSPKRLARRTLRTHPEFQGSHRDEVDPGGVTSIAPDGTKAFTPWPVLVRVSETKHAFHLLDHTGGARHGLPKRGLPSPDLIPALREFLNHSVSEPPPTTAPGPAAAGSRP